MKLIYIKPMTEVIAAQLTECIAYSEMDDQSPWFDAKANLDAYEEGYEEYEEEENINLNAWD